MPSQEKQVYPGSRDRFSGPSDNNPFNPKPLPEAAEDYDTSPGSPRWWLCRLAQKLMDRQPRFDVLEDYALGNHPAPNGDQRYVKALRAIQRKALTNYCELVIKAPVQRMKVKAFRFGPVGEVDEDASRIWMYNDMDSQSPKNLITAATFGVTYGLVSPADEPNGEPNITIEDPRTCITEQDPNRPTRTLASLRMWEDDILGLIVAVLVVGNLVYTYYCSNAMDGSFTEEREPTLSNRRMAVSQAGSWQLISIEANPLGDINPVVEGPWQPTHGGLSRAEHEVGLDIQDRINQQVLDLLVISKSQAYQQRWATGMKLPRGKKGQKAPPWEPGADMLWVTEAEGAKFGDFQTADLTQILAATRESVGDLAAITQTPATYLMNRMVNVSGDTLTQDQTALVSKVRLRQEAMGWFYERLMKLAFLYKGQRDKYETVEAQTLWKDPEVHSFAEMGDYVTKMSAAGVPLELLLERADFTPDEIAWAIKERDKREQMQMQREDQMAEKANEHAIQQTKAKPAPGGSAKK